MSTKNVLFSYDLLSTIMKVTPGIRMSSGKSEKRKEEEDSGDDLDRKMQAKLVKRIILVIFINI